MSRARYFVQVDAFTLRSAIDNAPSGLMADDFKPFLSLRQQLSICRKKFDGLR